LHTSLGDSFWSQTLALVNSGTVQAETVLTAFDDSGVRLNLPGVENPATTRIAPATQTLTSGPDPNTPGVQIFTDAAVTGVAVLSANRLLETLVLPRANAYRAVLPDIVRDATTSTDIHLANPTKFLNQVRLALWNGEGSLAGEASLTLESKARYAQPVEVLFPAMPEEFQGYVTLEAEQGVVAAQIVRNGGTAAALGAQVLESPERTPVRLYSPYFSAGGDMPATILNLVNPTTLDANVVVHAFADSGARVGSAVNLSLAAGRQHRRGVADILGLDPDAAVAGSLLIESSIRGVAGDVIIEDPLFGARYRTALPLDLEPQTTWLIPYVSNAAGMLSGVVVQNTTAAAANAQVRMLRSDGTVVGAAAPRIAGNGRHSELLLGMLPASAGQTGYLLVTADQPVIPFAVLARQTPTDLASVLPQPIPGSAPPPLSPAIQVTPTSLAFGSVADGQTADRTFTIRNTGTAALTVHSLISANARFSVVGPLTPFSLGPDGQQIVTVRFAPLATGAQSGTLAITSNASPASVALTGTGTATTGDTVLLQIDDGTYERAIGLSTGGTIYFVNRLTPPRYPATLRSVSIFFENAADALPPGYVILVLSGANPQGTANINGVGLLTTAATAGAADRFETFTVPPITISSGDFVVGFAVNNPVGRFPMSYDATAPAQGRSYVSPDGESFLLLESLAGTTPGDFAIRATVDLTQ
jgi:hypothetical protein